ncbi:MAG TPA: PP2C family protein-serine/threonine phosphatase, partial [Solirubrobacteraceae bacterium]|nr:PP2C family protein-serine/threonine phosphatase [Solirubrobacteraceae bacterium]
KLGQSPDGMLEMLHAALSDQPPGADLCTVCLIVLERGPSHARLTVTLAGHPQPLLIGADGIAERLGTPGTLLGVLDPIAVHEVHAELHPGQTLLLYTDGLPEAGRSSTQLGEQGLLELCAQAPDLTVSGLLEQIERVAIEHADGALRDDIALMALRVG